MARDVDIGAPSIGELDEIHDALSHVTSIFPADTDAYCTLTAHASADTWSTWAEVVDDAANAFSDAFVSAHGHLTSLVIETVSQNNTLYMLELGYGSVPTIITRGRFAGSGKFQAPNIQKRFWAPAVPAGETLKYRMKTGTGVADTCTVHFRYHLD